MRRLYFLLLLVALLCACGESRPPQGMLCSFEDDQELDRLRWNCHELMSLCPQYATHGRHSLKFEAYPSPYPGVTPRLPFEDWSTFNLLRFEVFNEQDAEVSLSVRIDDRGDCPGYGERYNNRLSLRPGPNSVTIPLGELRTSGSNRPLRLDSIRALTLFVPRPRERTVLYFDALRLE